MTMLSYHNDDNLKRLIVLEMQKHKDNDQFIKGAYGRENGVFKGCAVGCAIHSFNNALHTNYLTNDHIVFEEAIGVPEWLARLQDVLFEGLPSDESSQFAVNFLSSIPVGINLEPIKWKFCAFILKRNIHLISNIVNLTEELRKKVIESIQQVLQLHEAAIKKGTWDESAAESAAESARSAAWSAAESATWSAESATWVTRWSARSARSAAESAAWSAAWIAAESAAESAEYKIYAEKLLSLLKEELLSTMDLNNETEE
jgi:hypothetical protein